MAEEKKKRKRKGVVAEVVDTPVTEDKAWEKEKPLPEEMPAKPVNAELPFKTSDAGWAKPIRKLVVALDEAEYQLIQAYTKLWNMEHEGMEGYPRVDEGQFCVLSTLRWIDYLERVEAEGMGGGDAEDATPVEPIVGNVPVATVADEVDDYPEFLEALSAKIAGVSL
jgi:hypothetical protein